MFQQAVEKGVKYFGLIMDVITIKDLKKDIGHEPIKLYSKALEKQKGVFEILDTISQDKNIGRSELLKLINTTESLSAIDESEKEIQGLRNKDVHKDKGFIIDIYNKIIETNYIRTTFRNNSKTEKIIHNALLGSVKMFKEFASRATPFNAYKISIEFDYILENEGQKKKLLEVMPKIMRINMLIFKINQLLLLYSILVTKLDNRLRYPANESEAEILDSYTKKDLFIKMLPDFQNGLSLVFKELKKVSLEKNTAKNKINL